MPVLSVCVNGFRGFIQTFKFPTLPKGPRAEIANSACMLGGEAPRAERDGAMCLLDRRGAMRRAGWPYVTTPIVACAPWPSSGHCENKK